ncbi:MAG: hypothetical protein AMXMBFR84_19060 [Candidatus Hydrogenedentota bacterium]
MTTKWSHRIRVALAVWLVLVFAVPMPVAPAQEGAPSVDDILTQLLALDPAQLVAKLNEYSTQAAEHEAQAAALKQQADEAAQKAEAITQQLSAIEAHAKSLAAVFGMQAAPEAAMQAAAAPAPAMEAAAPPAEMAAAPAVTYKDHIMPIFRERCFKCHGKDSAKGGLALDTYDGLLEGGSSGAVITEGQPDASRLLKLVSGAEEPKMPPSGDPLTPEQIALIQQWIQLGAPVDANAKVAMAPAEAAPAENAVFVAATFSDGPPPMPEATLPEAQPAPAREIVARAVAASPRAPLVAVASYRQVLLYNAETFALFGALPFEEGEVLSLTFSLNGELLLGAGGDVGNTGKAVLWEVRTGKRVATLDDGYDTLLAADVSPDHTLVALGGPSRKVRVYSVADGSLKYTLEDHTDWILSVKFTPDGELLASADRAGGLRLWQAANGRPVEELRGHTGPINDLSYTADSTILASAGTDGTVQLWDTWKYTKIRGFNAHGGGVLSAQFGADNQIVTTGVDGQVKRWDVNGTNTATYEALPDWGYQVRFGKGGAVVMAGCWTGNVRVYDTQSGAKLADLSTDPATS